MSQTPYQPLPQPGSGQPVQSNPLGIAGFVVSLVGLIPCGLLCPIGLLLSFIAVFKPPRGFAIAGLIIGVLGTMLGATVGVGMIMGFGQLGGVSTVIKTATALAEAQQKIVAYDKAHQALPDDEEGEALIEDILDGNEMPLRYRLLGPKSFELRSAGPDKQFDTADDMPQLGTGQP